MVQTTNLDQTEAAGEIGQCLETGLQQLQAGNFSRAIILLTEAVRSEPGKIVALRGVASAYVLKGKIETARTTIQSFLAENPMADEAWRLLALLEYKQGDRDAAIAITEQGLTRIPGSEMLRKQIAIFHGIPWTSPDDSTDDSDRKSTRLNSSHRH